MPRIVIRGTLTHIIHLPVRKTPIFSLYVKRSMMLVLREGDDSFVCLKADP